MSRLMNLIEKTVEETVAITATHYSPWVDITGCTDISIEAVVSVATSTPSMTVGLQQANNQSRPYALGSTQACTGTGSFALGATDPQMKFVRVAYTVTTGHFTVSTYLLGKGPN